MQSSTRAFTASVQVRGRPVKEVHYRGRTYIEGRKGTDYSLHIRNDEYRRVLVIPSVDGLSVIDGKPAGKNSPGYIIEGHSEIDIPGWMVDGDTAAQFTFWPQDARGEATYVEELSKSGAPVDVGNQGMIGFLFIDEKIEFVKTYGSHQKGILRSSSFESDPMRGHSFGSTTGSLSQMSVSGSSANLGYNASADDLAGMGTKFGDATAFSTKTGEYKRGRVAGELVLEYDTLRGLKDRGVPIDLFKGDHKGYGTRSAFPADQAGCEPPKGWSK